ncbi:MAG: 6-phosphogluconolactonase [Acidobacteriota bacterium]
MAPRNGNRQDPRVREIFFDDRESLAESLASSIADSLYGTLTGRPRASLVVSGGSTPRPLFKALQGLELPWLQVDVTLADERWVDAEHDASNERFVRTELLADLAASAHFLPLKSEKASPEEGGPEIEAKLRRLLPFDVTVLGMGGDGHTASLFPDDPQIDDRLASDALCVAARPPSQPLPRLSLTPKALWTSRRLVLHITGQDKLDVYRRALQPGPVSELPIRAFLRGPTPIDVYWAP